MGGFGGDGAGGGADGEPFGGAGDAAPERCRRVAILQCVVSFFGEGGGFYFFVGKVALGGGEFGLAGLAVEGEIVERLQVFGGDDGLGWCVGLASVRRDASIVGARGIGGLQNDGRWQRISRGSSRTICAGVTTVRFSAASERGFPRVGRRGRAGARRRRRGVVLLRLVRRRVERDRAGRRARRRNRAQGQGRDEDQFSKPYPEAYGHRFPRKLGRQQR